MKSSTEQNNGTFPEIVAQIMPMSQIVESLADCLRATTTSRNGMTVPDCRIRLETAKLLLGYMIGTPVTFKEAEPVREDSNGGRGLENLLMDSPAIFKQVQDTLARVEARKRAIDV